MANVTRFGRKLKDEDSNNSKKGQLGGKGSTTSGSTNTETSGLRRSARETPSRKQRASSPPSTRKSERIEKRTPPTPPINKSSVRVVKLRMPSPLKRSERVENQPSSSSSGSKKSEKGLKLLINTGKIESDGEKGKQPILNDGESMKNEEADQTPVRVSSRKKRLDARSYRALLTKPKARKVQEPDPIQKLKGHDEKDTDKKEPSSSKEVEARAEVCDMIGEELRGEELEIGCERAVKGLSSGSKRSTRGRPSNHKEVEISYFTRKRKNRVDEAHVSDSALSSSVSKCSDDSMQSFPVVLAKKATTDAVIKLGCPTALALQNTELLESTSEGRSVSRNQNVERCCNVSPSKRKRNMEDLESDTSNEKLCTSVDTLSSFPSENQSDSAELCEACSKRQRFDLDSQKNVCFCNSERIHTSCNTSSPKKVCKTETELKILQNGGFPVTLQKNRNEEDRVHTDNTRGEAHVGNSDLLPELPRKIVPEEADLSVIAESGNLFHQDGGKVRAIDGAGPAEECAKVDGERCPPDTQMETDDKICVICKHGGDILCCAGNGCKRGYHLSCLEPPLKFFPPGSWHCFLCVKKKMKLGVHAVSGGIESVCDTREKKVSDGKGMQKQKEYFVKFKGIAHVHNRWIPEKQLIVEAPMLVKFKKNKAPLWKPEWALPHRLLHKRMLMSLKQHTECLTEDPDDTLNCRHEWLVKWSGLDYEHCTWELENAPFLRSPEAMVLIREYENRLLKAIQASDPSREDKKRDDSFIILSKLPGSAPSGIDNDHLSYVNKLRENWYKRRNAVVVEDQERILKTILFILSIESDICRPLLVVSPASSFSAWEAEFSRAAPSLNVVSYIGKRSVRKNIRALEFYEEGGCIMFQILLSTPDAVVEDLESLECIGWEMIIADECQHSRVSKHFEKIKILTTDFKLILVNGQIKDCITEYLNLLSFIDSGGDKNDDANLNNDSIIDSFSSVKERFTRFIACERKSESKFLEYWVPVRLSNVQIEHYCSILLSNSLTLRSCSKSDPVGALRNILISARKCCDHPYLLDESLQPLLTKDLPEIEYLNVGVDASGKLQVLDKILSEIKKRCLRALVIFQSIGGSGRNSIGDILDDFLRQRFGPDSYERVDSGLVTAKKQAALNMFNNKERGRFVFLIENRACLPSIKLASVDMVVLFDSDWNPLNDLRALQKITIDSQHKQLKVFRLYSSCTVEEKVLILAKQDMILDSNIQNINRGNSHTLLKWGASYLFKKLDEFHNGCTQSSSISTEQSFLVDVVQEILTLLQSDAENSNTRDFSLILKAQQSGGIYSKNISLLGEMEMQLRDEEVPHIFWANLLEGRRPPWRYSSGASPRSRKKVQYFDETPKRLQVVENDESTRKKKKVGSNIADPNSSSPWIEEKRNVPSTDMEGGGASAAANIANEISDQPKVHVNESEETRALQKNLHLSLIPEVSKLCETLQLPDGVKSMAEKLLEYIMNYFHVGNQSSTTLQALLLSLCWSAASLLKHKIDHRESFSLAKQHLNFECTEEETQPMYKKLRTLKRKFCHAENLNFSSSGSPAPENKEAQKQPSQARNSIPTVFVQEELEEGEIRINPQSISFSNQQDSTKEGQAPDSEKAQESPNNESGKAITQVKRFYSKRMRRIGSRQMKEYTALNKKMEEAKVWLEREHKIESAVIRTLHNQMSVRLEKLKVVDQNFEKKMEEFKLHKEAEHKRLQDMQQAERDEEKRLKSQWLKEARRGASVDPYVILPLPDSGSSMEGSDEDGIGSEKGVGVAPTYTGTSVQTLESTGVTTVVPDEATRAEISNIVSDEEVDVNVRGTELQTAAIGLGEVDNENNSRLDCDYRGSPSLGQNVTDSPLVEQHVALGPDLAVSSFQSGEMGECNTRLDSCGNDVVPSLEQNQRGSTFVEQHVVPAEDGGISSLQVDENSTRVDCLKNRDLSSEQAQIDSPLTQQPQDNHQASLLQETQSVAMNSGEADVENNTRLACDDGGSPSAAQSRSDPAFVQQRIAPVQDSQVSLAQPLTIQCSRVNPGTAIADCLEGEGLHSPEQAQINSPLAQQPQDCLASSLQGTQSVATSSGEMNNEHNTRVDDDNEVTLSQTQLDPPVVQQHIAPVQDSQVLLNQNPIIEQPQPSLQLSEVQTQLPPDNRLRRTSTQLMEDVSHLPAPVQNLLSNHSISQPEAHLQLHPPTEMSVSGAGTRVSDARGVSTVPESSQRLPTVAATSRMPPQFCTDPLRNELARLRKEEDQTAKMHEDLKLRLNTDCEKELEDIRRKYKALLQDAEVSLVQKKKELETHYNKIYMNRILAEAFRLKCSDSRTGVSAPPQGGPSVFMQQLSQLSSPQNFQRSAPLTGPSSTPPAAPPVQVVHNPSALFSSTPVRPLFNPLVSPSSNHQVGSEIRAPAPHLQPFRPTLSTSAATHSPYTPAQPSHSNPTGGSIFPQITPRPLMYASVPISRTHHVDGTNGFPVSHNPPLAALDMLMDVNNHPSANPSNLLSRMQAAFGPPGFESCNLSEPAMTGSSRGPAARMVPATDVVCLSDDD